jgi:acyl-CoA synthetase (AMP-forming)/AMP-acid ligase II
MEQLAETALLAAPHQLERTAVITADRNWSWRDIHAASMVLAERLDSSATVCNLCGSRLGFLVTALAALRRGCVQVLPPSGGHADLLATLQSSSNPVVAVDDAQLVQPDWANHARCLTHLPQPVAAAVTDAELLWTCDWDAPLVCLYTSRGAADRLQRAAAAHVWDGNLGHALAGYGHRRARQSAKFARRCARGV